MRISKKIGMILMTAGILGSLGAATTMAASKNKITSIRISVKDNLIRGEGVDEDAVEFESSDDDYVITGWEFENDSLVWSGSDVPKVTLQLDTEDDNSFSVTKDKVKIKGDTATVLSVKRDEPQTLFVTITLLPMSQRVGAVPNGELKGGIATWLPADGATGYEICLFRDSKAAGSKKVTTETTYDFSMAMLKDGEYYFRVNGIGGEGSKPGPFMYSSEVYKSPDQTSSGAVPPKNNNSSSGAATNGADGGQAVAAGVWQQNEHGWWWLRTDGTWPVSQMEAINGKWYIFNENGYMMTGWITLNNQWYYFGADGDMWINCQTPDGFTVDANGVRQ